MISFRMATLLVAWCAVVTLAYDSYTQADRAQHPHSEFGIDGYKKNVVSSSTIHRLPALGPHLLPMTPHFKKGSPLKYMR